jgi:dihydrolipoamide dehydrogenase
MKELPKKFKAIVIGGGPGGYASAIRIAMLGGSVCLVEKDKLGGACVNIGCIPTKFLVSVAKLLVTLKKSDRFGLNISSVSFDITKIKSNTDRVIMKSSKGIGSLLKSYGVHVVNGFASIDDFHKITIYENSSKKNKLTSISAENIVMAQGAAPLVPTSLKSNEKIITSNDVFNLTNLPKKLLIIGGGYIGLEFAFIFNALGAKVRVIEKLPRILHTEDEDVSKEIKRIMEKQDIEVMEHTELENVDKETEFDSILMAVGRRPNIDREELTNLGIKFTDKGIDSDPGMKTNIRNIYAIGDINGKSMLAHTATKEGIVAAENIMGKITKMNYDNIPNAIFTIPEIASVGRRKGKTGKFPFMANGKASTMNETEGFVKVYVEKDKLIGASIIGAEASDLIATVQGFLGKSLEEIKNMVITHPTLPEAIIEAILDVQGESHNLPKKN